MSNHVYPVRFMNKIYGIESSTKKYIIIGFVLIMAAVSIAVFIHVTKNKSTYQPSIYDNKNNEINNDCPKIGGEFWDTSVNKRCNHRLEKSNPIGLLHFNSTHDGVLFTG